MGYTSPVIGHAILGDAIAAAGALVFKVFEAFEAYAVFEVPEATAASLPLSAERLRDAILGLGGIAGFLLLPMLGAWLGLLLRFLEGDRGSIGPRRGGFSTLTFARALLLTIIFVFVLFNWQRAVGELREVQLEAAVIGPTLSGALVGLGLWATYALAIRILRTDYHRVRLGGRRLGGLR